MTTKPFILLSLHISTKDLPNWFWATFEHVDNIGRCDWLGCNDSFGYLNTQTLQVAEASAGGLAAPFHNFTSPKSLEKVDQADQEAFIIAERYSDVDRISDPLDAIFKAYGIAVDAADNTTGSPKAADAAWRSYRLKGTQTDFVTATGRAARQLCNRSRFRQQRLVHLMSFARRSDRGRVAAARHLHRYAQRRRHPPKRQRYSHRSLVQRQCLPGHRGAGGGSGNHCGADRFRLGLPDDLSDEANTAWAIVVRQRGLSPVKV